LSYHVYERRYPNCALQRMGAWGLFNQRQCHQDILWEWLFNPHWGFVSSHMACRQKKSGSSIHVECRRPGSWWH
jgi:hypothetical protein